METYRDNDNKFVLLRKILQNQNEINGNIVGPSSIMQSILSSLQPSQNGIICAPDIVVAAAGTAAQGANVIAHRGVLVIARLSNTGLVYVGGPNVTNQLGLYRGAILGQLGQPSAILPVSNLDQIWVNADTNGDAVGVIVL